MTFLGAIFSGWIEDLLRLAVLALCEPCLPADNAGPVSLHRVDPGTRVDQWEYG